MDMRKYSGKTFIKVDDVRGGPIQAKIAAVKEGQFDKPDLVFEDGDSFGLNATNTKMLIRAYGPESKNWIEKEIELFLGEIKYDGKLQEAVLVKPISPQIAAKQRTAAAEKLGDDEPSDSIPF